MFYLKKFGEIIKELRVKKNLTLLELSLDLHISSSYLNAIELSQKSPSIEVAVKIVNYFGIGFDESIDYQNDNTDSLIQDIHIEMLSLTAKEHEFAYEVLQQFLLISNRGDRHVWPRKIRQQN